MEWEATIVSGLLYDVFVGELPESLVREVLTLHATCYNVTTLHRKWGCPRSVAFGRTHCCVVVVDVVVVVVVFSSSADLFDLACKAGWW